MYLCKRNCHISQSKTTSILRVRLNRWKSLVTVLFSVTNLRIQCAQRECTTSHNAGTGKSLTSFYSVKTRRRPFIWEKTLNYHYLAMCVRQLIKVNSRKMLGVRVLLSTKTTFLIPSSILFDCIHGVLTWRVLPALVGGEPCPACRSSPWRFQWWCWPHSPAQSTFLEKLRFL